MSKTYLQEKITGTNGQVVMINSSGTAEAQGADAITPAAIGAAVPSSAIEVAMPVAGWAGTGEALFSAPGVTATNNIIVTPAPASYLKWCECQVRAINQEPPYVRFKCETIPDADLTANVLIVG